MNRSTLEDHHRNYYKSENSEENDSMKTGDLMDKNSDEKDDLEEEEEDFDENEEEDEDSDENYYLPPAVGVVNVLQQLETDLDKMDNGMENERLQKEYEKEQKERADLQTKFLNRHNQFKENKKGLTCFQRSGYFQCYTVEVIL